MLNSILHYMILFFVTGLFSLIYFKLLKNSINKVLSKEKSFNYIYFSFILRMCLTFLFFFFVLKYYRSFIEIAIIIVAFVFFRYLSIRKDKNVIKKK